jgi:hypothetical protein
MNDTLKKKLRGNENKFMRDVKVDDEQENSGVLMPRVF